MTADLIREARAMLEGVTPGPWWTEPNGTVRNDADGNPRWDLPRIVRYDKTGHSVCKAHLIGGADPDPAIANARFIAWARNNLAAMADALEAAEAKAREAALDALAAYGQANEAYEAQLKAEARVAELEAMLSVRPLSTATLCDCGMTGPCMWAECKHPYIARAALEGKE